VKNDGIWSDYNVVRLESNLKQMTNQPKQGGLVRIHPESGQVTAFEVGKTISHPWVMCLAVTDGRVWVGTFGKGIDVFDKVTDRWSNISEQDGLPSNFIQCMEADDESLWVGTGRFGRGGVARFRFRTRQWQSYLPGDSPNAPPPTAPVRCMKRVAGRLWCAMPRAIYSYDLEANHWSQRPSSNHFTSIEACAGCIWFGADQFSPPGPLCGILHCDLRGEDWQILRQVDGLPDIAVTAMAESRGKLLLGTYGFMMLDPAQKTFSTCDMRKEQSKWSYVVSSLLVANGRLWMACRGGSRLRWLDWNVP
jgi:ligand-binding sensor domain-containing protein